MSAVITVLGPWRLAGVDGETILVRVAVQRLMAFLVLRGRLQHRSLVAGCLWPESSDCRASANLRSVLCHARAETPGLVDGDSTTIWLSDDVWADYDAATDLVRAVLLRGVALEEHQALLAEDVLPQWSEAWVLSARFVHRQLRLLALEQLAQGSRAGDPFESDTRELDLAEVHPAIGSHARPQER